MVNATQKFRWIDYFDVEIQSTNQETLVAHLILPFDDHQELERLLASKTIETLKAGIWFVYFCLYTIVLILIVGGVRKIYTNLKKLRDQ